jgi:hypothetical protein
MDYRISLKPDIHPRFELFYGLSKAKLKAQKEWLDDNLKKRFIKPSSFLIALLIHFVKKRVDLPRPGIDYQKLN